MLASRIGRLRGAAVPFALWSGTIAAGLSLGAAAIHFAAIADHFAEFAPYGIAFAALAWFQVGWAIACLFMPRPSVAIVGVVVNLGALLTWAASRTVGLPFGPDPGQIEPVGPLDLVASTLEIVLIAVLAWELGAIGRRIRPALPRARAVAVVGSTALAVVLLTTTAFVAAGGDAHGGAGHELPPIGAADTPSGSPPLKSATPAPEPSTAGGSDSPPFPSPPRSRLYRLLRPRRARCRLLRAGQRRPHQRRHHARHHRRPDVRSRLPRLPQPGRPSGPR